MVSHDDKLKMLLDGDLGSEALEEDPILAKLAERIYGEEFLEQIGISRGESKRALSESLTEDDDSELMIEVIPSLEPELPPIEEFIPPTALELPEIKKSSNLLRNLSITGLLFGTVNLYGGFQILGGGCSGGGCPTDGETRLNLARFWDIGSGWGWSPSILEGSIGIPDIVLVIVCGLGLFLSLRK